ncbi:MAG: hypothetical protein JSR39_05520 [Verrucomicrobia bacterium]|nr:hypothetical protein [Verrucomicrobiota bacterium]
MLSILAFSAALALLLYFAVLFVLRKKAKDLFLSLLFTVQAALLFAMAELHNVSGSKMAVLLAIPAMGLGLAFASKNRVRSPVLPILLVSTFSIAAYLYSSLFHLSGDKEILKITLTGNTQKQIVEWKSPKHPLTQAEMTCYEVVISTMDDKPLCQAYVYGDFCAVRCKIIRLHPLLNQLGLSNLYHIDAVYNGYRTAEDYSRFPVEATSLAPLTSPLGFFERFFWRQWSKNFNNYYTSKWIKSATLESNYFPLTQASLKPYCGSFLLTITPGGLSSIPLLGSKANSLLPP